MSVVAPSLLKVYEGWDGYQLSLVRAIAPRSPKQLDWRVAPQLRSVGEIAAHISLGRVEWWQRMQVPESTELASRVATLQEKNIAASPSELVQLLEDTWQMIEKTLRRWTVDDLAKTYLQSFQGKTYVVSRQWTLWHIMAHDIHHGGQLSVMLGAQAIELPDLLDWGGHITEPPLVEAA